MSKKLALVVDDSKLARFVLREMLVKEGFEVATSESAEEALGYLCAHRPDVIFMDHNMPGMDGFKAVQAIKNDPKTAMIPIMMYTSKEGEVYVSQARALGAVGVLPKQLKPFHLKLALDGLRIRSRDSEDVGSTMSTDDKLVPPNGLEKAESGSSENIEPVHDSVERDPAADVEPVAITLESGINGLSTPEEMQQRLDNLEELARSAVSSVESQSSRKTFKRMLEDQRLVIRQDFESTTSQVVDLVLTRLGDQGVSLGGNVTSLSKNKNSFTPERRAFLTAGSVARVAAIVILAMLPAIWFAVQYQAVSTELSLSLREGLREQESKYFKMSQIISASDELHDQMDALVKQSDARGKDMYKTIEWAINTENSIPYDNVLFGEKELQKLTMLMSHLVAIDFKGTVKLVSHVANFCVVEDLEGEGWLLAPESLPAVDCQMTGFVLDDAYSVGEKQTIEFGNYLSNIRVDEERSIRLEVATMGNHTPRVDYPDVNELLRAGEWNKAAARNNRVEIFLLPEDLSAPGIAYDQVAYDQAENVPAEYKGLVKYDAATEAGVGVTSFSGVEDDGLSESAGGGIAEGNSNL